jgi:hypothetical protein
VKLLSTRRRKVVAATAATALVAGAAVAALILHGPIDGSGSVNQAPVLIFTGTPTVTSTSGSPVVCSILKAGDGSKLTVTFDNAIRGVSWCRFSAQVAQANDPPTRFQNIRWAAPTDESFLSGVCGSLVSQSLAAPSTFGFEIRAAAGAPTGSFTAEATAGIETVDDYVDASCPRAS